MNMNFNKKNWHKLFVLAFAFLLSVTRVYADTSPVPPSSTTGTKLVNPIGQDSLIDFIKAIFNGALKLGIPIIALAIIYCGFLFVAARGNSEKLSKAKDALLYTCIGAAILLGSWAIATMISSTVSGLG